MWSHPVSTTDRALSSSSTLIAISCPHFRYIQYNINALYCFSRRCGLLLEMLFYQRLVSFHFLFIQNSPYQLGSSRLANIRIFNLGICGIYCFGVFPSPSPLGTFISAALSLMDNLSSRVQSWIHTEVPGVVGKLSLVLIPPFFSSLGGVCRPNWFISSPHALGGLTKSCFSWWLQSCSISPQDGELTLQLW